MKRNIFLFLIFSALNIFALDYSNLENKTRVFAPCVRQSELTRCIDNFKTDVSREEQFSKQKHIRSMRKKRKRDR